MPTTENYITQSAGDARYQALGSLGSTTPTTVDAGDTGTAGVSSSAARQDHEHPVSITSAQLVPAAWLAGWTSYTPTLTQSGTVTKTVTYAKYIQMGKTVIVSVRLDVTGTGTAATAIVIGLPVTAAGPATFLSIGRGSVNDSSAGARYMATAIIETSKAAVWLSPDGSTANSALGAAVMTAALASGDTVEFSATYEAT